MTITYPALFITLNDVSFIKCKSMGCTNFATYSNRLCKDCTTQNLNKEKSISNKTNLVSQYPKYYKDVSKLTTIDVYQVHQLFGISDESGALQHASKKLLLSGVRTGGKTKFQDIQEARDTLNRWLEINSPKLV